MSATIFLVTGMIGAGGTFWVEQLRAACKDPQCLQQVRQSLPRLGNEGPEEDVDDIIEGLKRMSAEKRQTILGGVLPSREHIHNGNCMLGWEQVREMGRNGIDFGSHTDSHPLLPYEHDVEIERELKVSKEKLEIAIERKVRAFAYPNGDWNELVRTCVQQAGFECAFTTQKGWYSPRKDRFTAPRILLHDGNVTGSTGRFSPAAFSLTLMGWR
jgi:peptidoglycan/xylan/chitin deacetylase (PgdA/CDA1 family)